MESRTGSFDVEIARPKNNWAWENILFFVFTMGVSLFWAPYYIFKNGLPLWNFLLFFFYVWATGLSITFGYHRLFSHSSFKANGIVRFFVLFFGAAAFEQSCLKWCSQHRIHHQFVDTKYDPYNIKQGFFHAHIGWLMFWDYDYDFRNVTDLQKDPVLMHQHKYYLPWALTSSVFVPTFIGFLFGDALGAFIISVCLRLVIVHHSTFFINSICHMFGKGTFNPEASAKDCWFIALLTFGEGYHNFHHRFSGDYRNGVAWYAWDPTKWLIYLLSKIGFTWDLKQVSKFVIYKTEIKTHYEETLADIKKTNSFSTHATKLLEQFHEKYDHLKQHLEVWEDLKKQYRALLSKEVSLRPPKLLNAASKKVADARKRYYEVYEQWRQLSQNLQLAAA